jgi:dephospho-CoA kinase
MSRAAQFRARQGWLLVDIPLLFETGAESAFDVVGVVACSAQTQRRRIVEGRGLPEKIADGILAAQLSLESKIARAAHLFWTDAPEARTEDQAQLFAGYLKEHYG